MNNIFYHFFTKKSIALSTRAIVDLVYPNSAIDSKKEFAIDLFSLVRPDSPIEGDVDPLILDLSE